MAGDYSELSVAVTANTQQMSRQVAAAAIQSGDAAGQSMASRMGKGLGSMASSVGKTIATGFTVATGAAAAFGGEVVKSGIAYNTLYQTAARRR